MVLVKCLEAKTCHFFAIRDILTALVTKMPTSQDLAIFVLTITTITTTTEPTTCVRGN